MPDNRSVTERRLTYSALSIIFMSALAAFSIYQGKKRQGHKLTPFEFAQLAFASYRLGRMVAYDKIFETYRSPFARTGPDPTGAGDTTMPRGHGVREAIGELITCPICAGTWIAAGLFYLLNLFPAMGRTLLAIMSAIGMAEFLQAATEAFEWLGQAEREEAGSMEMNKQHYRH